MGTGGPGLLLLPSVPLVATPPRPPHFPHNGRGQPCLGKGPWVKCENKDGESPPFSAKGSHCRRFTA